MFLNSLDKTLLVLESSKLMTLILQGHLNENFNALENFEKRHNMEFIAERALTFYFERTAEVLRKMEQEL